MDELEERWAEVGRFVRAMRAKSPESQNSFCDRIGLSPNKFVDIRDGKPGNYRPETLVKVSIGLWGPDHPDAIERILRGEPPVEVAAGGSKLELQGLGAPDLVIELPRNTEFGEGETVYLVVEVKGGTALADQLLANAPWAETKETADATLAEANRLIEEGHVFDVKIGGHDAPATLIATTDDTSDQLRLAARRGDQATPEARAEIAERARQALKKASTKPKAPAGEE